MMETSREKRKLVTAKRRIDVVGAVIVAGDLVLAARRGAGMALAGTWEFPGGKVERGESPRHALRRELLEELRCTVEVGAHVETTEHEYEFGVVVLSTYYCTLVDGVPQPTEHAELRWMPVAQLAELDWAPADVPAVQRVMGTR